LHTRPPRKEIKTDFLYVLLGTTLPPDQAAEGINIAPVLQTSAKAIGFAFNAASASDCVMDFSKHNGKRTAIQELLESLLAAISFFSSG